jgi:hypothetical protein
MHSTDTSEPETPENLASAADDRLRLDLLAVAMTQATIEAQEAQAIFDLLKAMSTGNPSIAIVTALAERWTIALD